MYILVVVIGIWYWFCGSYYYIVVLLFNIDLMIIDGCRLRLDFREVWDFKKIGIGLVNI